MNQIIKSDQLKMPLSWTGQQQKQRNICNKIIDGLYIGSKQILKDQQYMLLNFVTHIVKIKQQSSDTQTQVLQFQKQNHDDIVLNAFQQDLHIHLLNFKEITSSQKYQKDNNLQKTLLFIDQARENGECCLIIEQNQYNPGSAFTLIVIYFIQRFSWSLLKTLQFMNFKLKGIRVNQNHYNYLTNFQYSCLLAENKILSYNWNTYINQQDLVLRNTYLNANATNLVVPQIKIQKISNMIQNCNNRSNSKISLRQKINPLNKLFDQNKNFINNNKLKAILKQNNSKNNIKNKSQRVEFNLNFNCIKQFKKQEGFDILSLKFKKSQPQTQINLSVQKLIKRINNKIQDNVANQNLKSNGNQKKLKKHKSLYRFCNQVKIQSSQTLDNSLKTQLTQTLNNSSKTQPTQTLNNSLKTQPAQTLKNCQLKQLYSQTKNYQNQVTQIVKNLNIQKRLDTQKQIKQLAQVKQITCPSNFLVQKQQHHLETINKIVLETMHSTNQDDRYSSLSLSPCKHKDRSESFKQNIQTMQTLSSAQLTRNSTQKLSKTTKFNSLIKLQKYPKSKKVDQSNMCCKSERKNKDSIILRQKCQQFKWR